MEDEFEVEEAEDYSTRALNAAEFIGFGSLNSLRIQGLLLEKSIVLGALCFFNRIKIFYVLILSRKDIIDCICHLRRSVFEGCFPT